MIFFILSLEGDNTSDYNKLRSQAKHINKTIADGQYAKLPSHVEYYTRHGDKVQDEIIFRYISKGELGNLQEGAFLPNKDINGNTVEKYVTPDLYLYSGRAKQRLSLPVAPDYMTYTFRSLIQETLNPQVGWNIVAPDNGEIGGGREGTIFQPFPMMGLFELKKE